MRHLVLTRFGIGVLNEAWLNHRLMLIEATVAPSLKAQTSQEFEWVVVVGNDMPAEQLARLKKIISMNKNFYIFEINHLRDGYIPRDYMVSIHANEGSLITTRIDDDDALHVCAIEEIQKSAFECAESGLKEAVIYHPRGYELQAWSSQIAETTWHGPSMGLSAYSTRGRLIHAYSFAHNKIKVRCEAYGIPIKTLCSDRPSWLYFRHMLGDSVRGGASNISDAEKRVDITDSTWNYLEKDFGIKPDLVSKIISLQQSIKPIQLDRKWKVSILGKREKIIELIRETNRKIELNKKELEKLESEYSSQHEEYVKLSKAAFDGDTF